MRIELILTESQSVILTTP